VAVLAALWRRSLVVAAAAAVLRLLSQKQAGLSPKHLKWSQNKGNKQTVSLKNSS